MAKPPDDPPRDELAGLVKDVPRPVTPLDMGGKQPVEADLVQPLPTPGAMSGGVAQAGQQMHGAGTMQAPNQQFSPEVRATFEKIWGTGEQKAVSPAPAHETPTPSPADPPDLLPDV